MFKEWGFLITEMVVLLVIAALLGLLVGWLIWGRRSEVAIDTGEADRLRSDLDNCRAAGRDKDAEIADLKASVEKAAAIAVAESDDDEDKDYDGDGIVEGTAEGTRPEALDGPRGGEADDLKRIKGVGPKMEELCNQLGFYHFDQIANWTADEVAWVDANLEGFKGRVSRDNWVEQAKVLATGGETEFSKRVDDGEVY
jgi:predicted flap endonuclease-1-like 5' DNA nuclease